MDNSSEYTIHLVVHVEVKGIVASNISEAGNKGVQKWLEGNSEYQRIEKITTQKVRF